MRIITKAEVIASVPARWARQYPRELHLDDGRAHVRVALAALPRGFSAEQVDAIIGNNSWTRLECDICGDDVEAVVVLTPEHYESERRLDVCLLCLDTAGALLAKSGGSS